MRLKNIYQFCDNSHPIMVVVEGRWGGGGELPVVDFTPYGKAPHERVTVFRR